MSNQKLLDRWHDAVLNNNGDILDELLADDVEFHSPTLWAPKKGKDVTKYILQMIGQIFEDFEYQREFIDGDSFALEFSAKVEGKGLKGIDLIRWNDEGQIIHFEVMIRPLNALQLIFAKMTDELRKAGFLPAE